MSEPTDPFSATTDVRALAASSSTSEGSASASSSGGAALAASPGSGPSSSGERSGSSAPVAEGEILAGKYRIERVLGQGGVGVVVAAMHIRLKQRVAIKFLLSNASGEMNERFLREAQAAVKLKSEHAAKVLDVGELPNGAPYMVLEFLEGSDLSDHLMWHGPLSIEDAAEYLLQVCEAMAEAHAAGIVHRDLKPANLFLTQTGGRKIVKVLDFGISKDAGDPGGGRAGMSLTKTAAVFGSPLYMPPEQMRSARDVDARSDIWSMGVILYELLTGRPPFDAEMYPDLVVKITVEPAAPPSSIRRDLPSKLDAVILRCLEKKPANRFQDVGKLAAALAPFAPTHARVSVDRIQKTLEAASPRESALGGPQNAAQARTDPSLRSSAGTRGAKGRMVKVVALTVVGSTALVIGAAAILGVFSGPREKTGSQPITPATEKAMGAGAVMAAASVKAGEPTPGVTPAGEPSAAARGNERGDTQKAQPSKTPQQGSATPQTTGAAPQPTQAANEPAPTAAAPQTAAPPPTTAPAPTTAPKPPPAPTKKNPLEMELQ